MKTKHEAGASQILRLIKKVTTVSMETSKAVKEIDGLIIENTQGNG